MSCYKPLVGLWNGYTETGKKYYEILGNSHAKEYKPNQKLYGFDAILIPCGRCIGCRLDYSRSWADRMMLELETSGKGIFVTLTYDDEHLEKVNGNLNKREVQLWMKRIRKEFKEYKIRFYAAGEYGSLSGRCHYHAILFGIGLEDIKDLKFYKKTKLGYNLYTSERINKTWTDEEKILKGYVILAPVTWQSCAYVARYVAKKLQINKNMSFRSDGEDFLKEIDKTDIVAPDRFYKKKMYLGDKALNPVDFEPEFSLMSRKPGIGREYLDLHPECLDMANINISTPEGALKISIPKYYLKQLEKINPERYEKLKEIRKQFADDKLLLELSKTDLDFQEYLDQKQEKLKNRTNALIRNDI